MKEIVSGHDDLEKRMAIFIGLGAFVFSSLYLFIQGADLLTYVIRGVIIGCFAAVIGWFYGSYFSRLVKRQQAEERGEVDFELRATDAENLEGMPIDPSTFESAVIPETGSGAYQQYDMPAFDTADQDIDLSRFKTGTIDITEDSEIAPPTPSGV